MSNIYKNTVFEGMRTGHVGYVVSTPIPLEGKANRDAQHAQHAKLNRKIAELFLPLPPIPNLENAACARVFFVHPPKVFVCAPECSVLGGTEFRNRDGPFLLWLRVRSRSLAE
jgi:hypothetical protein